MDKVKKQSLSVLKEQYEKPEKNDTRFANDRKRWASNSKKFILAVFKTVILVGICYVILGPVIGIISSSFFSDSDYYNTMVYLIPQEPTLERYKNGDQVYVLRKDRYSVFTLFPYPDAVTGICLFHGRLWICKISVPVQEAVIRLCCHHDCHSDTHHHASSVHDLCKI